MDTVKVSSKYQVVIPEQVRKHLGIRPGQKCRVMLYEGRIELIPVQPMRRMRGFLKGIDTHIEREPDRI
jgi:AbrB family looped-hinge helix DNA binding protein